MKQFLRQVAENYYGAGDMQHKCFIFPNRRSEVFFNKWLSETVKCEKNSKPLVAPVVLTMNEFFYKVSDAVVTDRVGLLLELYDCYKSLNPKAESLDDFIFWGDVILSDFDDTDKYLADPKKLYTNVADFKEIQDSYSYLTEVQLKAITHFISHFRKGGKLTVNLSSENPDVKERFLMIWNLLYPLYSDFNKVLKQKNMSYEGMVHRAFADRLKTESAVDILSEAFPHTTKFIFVGLNALNECEKTVMRRMRDAGVAEFCWDFSSEMLRDPLNRSSMFMSQNVLEFPQAFKLDQEDSIDKSTRLESPDAQDAGRDSKAANPSNRTTLRGLADGVFKTGGVADKPGPEIHVISLPSAIGQAKQIPEILKSVAQKIAEQKNSGYDLSSVGQLDVPGADTAIVLPDENMLIPVLNSIPSEIGSINVTMGYPMSGSDIYGLMNSINSLQLHIRKGRNGYSFYHKQVWAIFASGIMTALMDEQAKSKVAEVKVAAKYYIPQEDLSGVKLFDLIFRPVLADVKTPDAGKIREYEEYQLEILSEIGSMISKMSGMALEVHFAKQYYLAVNRLKSKDLNILPITYARLLQQLVGSISVPFKGEPLKGLQIMGPLETRSLDFTNLIVLSCNEGVFPRKSVSSSFIPPELRKGFGLPTYENQDAVWSYYFFRMIQRAKNVWLLYDSRTEGLKSGEESRYIKQLEYQYRYPRLDRTVVKYGIGAVTGTDEICKSAEDLERLRTMMYSASSVQNYLACPAKFYYGSVKKLKPGAEVAESMDGGMLGSVFHDTMFALYTGGEALSPDFDMDRQNVTDNVSSPLKEITAEYIEELLHDKRGIISAKIRSLVKKQLNAEDVAGRNLVLEDVVNQYVVRTLEKDLQLMKDKGVGKFTIIGLEQQRFWNFDGHKFVGYIDRMDSFTPDEVRIVDYKTGKVDNAEVCIDESNAEKVATDLFSPDTAYSKRPKIALQLFLYDMYVADDKAVAGKKVRNVLYPVPKLFSEDILTSPECADFNKIVSGKLKDLFAEMMDPEVSFRRTDDVKCCEVCDFRKICGR